MKVEKGKAVFTPITITIETEEEWEKLVSVLERTIADSPKFPLGYYDFICEIVDGLRKHNH